MSEKQILTVENIRTTFSVHKRTLEAVRGVDIHVDEGEFFAVVGESGSGKSVLMKSIMGILPDNAKVTADKMEFAGKDLMSLSSEERRRLRGQEIAMIFQDPMTALNPVKKIGAHLTEVIRRYRKVSKAEAYRLAVEALAKVGIPSPESRMEQYPHEFSGGMRQRVMIAMALSCSPKLLIADEPTTALDVTIQAQILELMQELQKKLGMAIIMVTHDLGVIADMCDKIIVMYGGSICERGTADDIFYSPSHEYTKGLLRSIPNIGKSKERLVPISGTPINLLNMPKGCAFCSRCDNAMKICLDQKPEEMALSETHKASCWMNVKRMMEEQSGGARA